MSDDFDDEPRRSRKRSGGSGNSTVKIFLILFASLAGVGLIACCGAGGYLWYAGRNLLKNVAANSPVDVRNLTAEMTDIDIPPEFVPQQGMNLFGVKLVQYQWCPSGNCSQPAAAQGILTLTSVPNQSNGQPNPSSAAMDDEQITDAELQESWSDYTKTEHEFPIRGRNCKFRVIQGTATTEMAEEFETDEAQEVETSVASPGPAKPPRNPAAAPGQKMVLVTGSFPGKLGEVSLNMYLAPADYDEEKILGMLRSIR